MTELICTLVLAAIVGTLSYLSGHSVGLNEGRVSVFRGEVVCQTLIDGAVRCVPKEQVKP